MRGEGPFARYFDEVAAPEAMRRFVLAELSRPARRWHGLLHHALMLRQIVKAGHGTDERRQLIRAVLFHDIVYDATRSDNEEASAEEAMRWVDDPAVVRLILATKAHDLAGADPVTRTLLEADLAVLWTPSSALYAHYARGIRAEYGHVPAPAYRAGRTAVLDRLEGALAIAIAASQAHRLSENMSWERGELARGALDAVPTCRLPRQG